MLFKKTATPRKVFGFLCSQNLCDLMRDLATLLGSPIYCVSEHSLEIGAISIVTAYKDEELQRALKDHLTEEHLLKQTLSLNNEYNVGVAQQALKQEVARIRRDKLARQLVTMVEDEGVPAKLLIDITERLIETAKQRSSHANYTKRRQQQWEERI